MAKLRLQLANGTVDDIQLANTPAPWQFPIPMSSELEFLSCVEISKVPLALISGPPCDVWTNNAATAQWFEKALTLHLPQDQTEAHGRVWWQETVQQSEIGVLAEIKEMSAQILFYAVVDGPGDEHHLFPHDHPQDPTLRVQALPLRNEFLSALPSPPPSPVLDSQDSFQFLPSIEALCTEAIATEKKRKRVEEVFDTATSQQRKARRRGGESIAAAASKLSNVNILMGQKKDKPSPLAETTKQRRRSSISQQRDDSAMISPPIQASRPYSRSPSFSSDTRPASRRGLLESTTKRSSLSCMTSLSEHATVENANKEMISRLVTAGMRLYGMERKKKNEHSRRHSENLPSMRSINAGNMSDGLKEEAAKDEEYKLMYHQTYKAACFTHRKHICEQPLHMAPEPLRETVDKLLAIFCAEPGADG